MLSAARVVALALVLAACRQPRSKLCTDVCAKEAECTNKQEPKNERAGEFDEAACVAACSALLRDQQTEGRVKSHATCVQQAGEDCSKVVACP